MQATALVHEAYLRLFGNQQPDAWTTASAKRLLGEKRYAEAEPLLLSGYEELKQRFPLKPRSP